MSFGLTKARLAAYIPFESGYEVGFALPVFQGESRTYLIQSVNEMDGKIEGFFQVNNIGSESIRSQSSLEVSLGDYAHYSFVNEKQTWHLGTLENLRTELLRFYKECPEHVFLNLQIAELVGSKDMCVESRAKVYQSIARKAGYAAARSFLTATLRHSLWRSLLSCAVDQSAATDLMRNRRHIMAKADWEEPDLLPERTWVSLYPLLSVDRHEIIDQLRGERSAVDTRSRPKMIDIYTLEDDVPLRMPYGSTPIDVAYHIHTILGDEAVGAKVNNRVVPLRTWLRDGDRLTILRSSAQTAQPGWLSFVFTDYAYQMIHRSLRRRGIIGSADPREMRG